MNPFQLLVILIYIVSGIVVLVKSVGEVIKKENPFGLSHAFGWMGIFVWGDGLIIGIFWIIGALTSIFLQDFHLFLLIISVFWSVRSMGEMIYWLNQQFSKKLRNPPETLIGYKWIKNESIWFVYQVFWQCIMVASIIASIYLVDKLNF